MSQIYIIISYLRDQIAKFSKNQGKECPRISFSLGGIVKINWFMLAVEDGFRISLGYRQ